MSNERPNLRLHTSGRASAPAHPEPPVRVLLADRHAAMRRSLKQLLEGEQDLLVVAETADLSDIAHQLHIRRPHVLLIDLNFPAALQAIRDLSQCAADVSIIATGLREDPAFPRAAIAAGASDYVLKDQSDVRLPAAIREARARANASGLPTRTHRGAVRRAASG